MSQRRALFYAVFRPFSRATEGGENSSVPAHVDGVIPPMPGRDHPSVQVHDPHQFDPVKTGLDCAAALYWKRRDIRRSEEHTSELQSLMRISYAVFCLQKTYTT